VVPQAYSGFDAAALRAQALQVLPGHLVPAQFIAVEQLPLTANGKLDERRLRCLAHVSQPRSLVAPASELERDVLQIWQELLRRDDISVDDNFFELGGHSLLAMRLFVRINAQYQTNLEYRSFFERSSVRIVAAQIESRRLLLSLSHKKKVKSTII
jgi:acyl carrier protein